MLVWSVFIVLETVVRLVWNRLQWFFILAFNEAVNKMLYCGFEKHGLQHVRRFGDACH